MWKGISYKKSNNFGLYSFAIFPLLLPRLMDKLFYYSRIVNPKISENLFFHNWYDNKTWFFLTFTENGAEPYPAFCRYTCMIYVQRPPKVNTGQTLQNTIFDEILTFGFLWFFWHLQTFSRILLFCFKMNTWP